MPLNKQLVNIGIKAGLDQTSDRFTQDGVLFDAKNIRFTHDGAAEIRKGHTLVGQLAQTSQKSKLITDGSQLKLLHRSRQYSVTSAGITGGNNIVPSGVVEQVAACSNYGPRIVSRDIAVTDSGNAFFVMWNVDHGGLGFQTYGKLFDSSWNEIPCAATAGIILPSGSRWPRVNAIGEVFYITHHDPVFIGQLRYSYLDCTALAAPSWNGGAGVAGTLNLMFGAKECLHATGDARYWGGVQFSSFLIAFATTGNNISVQKVTASSPGVLVPTPVASQAIDAGAALLMGCSIARNSGGQNYYIGYTTDFATNHFFVSRYEVATSTLTTATAHPAVSATGRCTRCTVVVKSNGDVVTGVTQTHHDVGYQGFVHSTYFQKFSFDLGTTKIALHGRDSHWCKIAGDAFLDQETGDAVCPVLLGGQYLYSSFGPGMPDVTYAFLTVDAMLSDSVQCPMPCTAVMSPGYSYMEEDRAFQSFTAEPQCHTLTNLATGDVFVANTEFYSGTASSTYYGSSSTTTSAEMELSSARTVVLRHSKSRAGNLHCWDAGGYYAAARVSGIQTTGATCPVTSPAFCLTTTAPPATLGAGTYNYLCCYTSLSSDGRVIRSAPSNTVLSTTAMSSAVVVSAPNGANTVTCPWPSEATLPLDYAGGATLASYGTFVELYRTNASTVTGTERLVTQSFMFNTFGAVAGQTFSFSADVALDNQIATNRTLYTVGGALPNSCPPAMVALAMYRGRLYGIDYTRRRIWFTKQTVDGEVPAFVADFTLELPWPGYALAVMDDKLVVFGDRHIGAIAGWGPADSGINNDLGDVQNVAADVGCVSPESIVLTPDGLIFLSQVGFYKLNRSLNLSYVGLPIQDTQNQYPNVDCACIHTDDFVAMWGCSDSNGNGIRIVYNYILDRWSYDVIGSMTGSGYPGRVLSMVAHKGLMYLLVSENGGAPAVIVETPTSYLDGGAFIPAAVEVSSSKLAGLNGFQRAWKAGILGERFTDHNLTIKVATDDELTPTQSHTFDSAAVSAFPLRENLLVRIVRQLCRSVRVRVEVTAPTGVGAVLGNGRGMSLSGLLLEVGVHDGAVRLPAGQKG
jgi:hypothetical protein